MENFPFGLSDIWGPILNTKLHHIAEIYKLREKKTHPSLSGV